MVVGGSGDKKRELEISINLSIGVSAKSLRALARYSKFGHWSPRTHPLVHSSWQLTWRDIDLRATCTLVLKATTISENAQDF